VVAPPSQSSADSPAAKSNTSITRRRLGLTLRHYRTKAKRTIADVAEADIFSTAKVSRIEGGRQEITSSDVEDLCLFYGVDLKTIEELKVSAKQTRRRGGSRRWTEELGVHVPEKLKQYAGLEALAYKIDIYGTGLVDGLLQTREYAEAVIRTNEKLDEAAVFDRVEFRVGRQEAVWGGATPPQVRCVLDEAALRLRVGSETTMRNQMQRLTELPPVVDVRVWAFALGPHQWMEGGFSILRFTDPLDPDFVHNVTQTTAQYNESPEALVEYQAIFDALYDRAIPIKEFEDQ
jgi:transcriptional regulator with XRE-family HTH domain